MSSSPPDRIIAFAALVQAAQLVDDIAQGRPVDSHDLRPLLASIFATDPTDMQSIYGDITDL
ncbi:MAG: lysogenization regulator HflD, partial [Gammaproteobacteria bacterium]|nr:lysogenization regulator HflD [Gammaproteobacteria bacterium]